MPNTCQMFAKYLLNTSHSKTLAKCLPNTCQILANCLPNTCLILAIPKFLPNSCQRVAKYLPKTCQILAKCLGVAQACIQNTSGTPSGIASGITSGISSISSLSKSLFWWFRTESSSGLPVLFVVVFKRYLRLPLSYL